MPGPAGSDRPKPTGRECPEVFVTRSSWMNMTRSLAPRTAAWRGQLFDRWDLVEAIHGHGGLAIASHVERRVLE